MGVRRSEPLKTKTCGAAAKTRDVKKADFYGEPSDWLPIGGLEKRRKSSCAGTGARAFSARAGIWKGGAVCVILSQRDVDILKLLCWCQFIQPRDLKSLATEAERKNLMGMGLVRRHEKSGALLLTSKGQLLLEHLLDGAVPQTTRAYHPPLIERRIRVSRLVMTAYHGGVNPFTFGPEELDGPASLFLPAITRRKGANPWGSTRVAAIARLGDSLYAMHYVCPGIGKVALMDELAAFSNQTARFRDMGRAFLFAGSSYKSVLSELGRPPERKDAKLLTYGGAYRCLQLPVHLLSCDATGAVQLQIMAVPDYRARLTKAALKNQYRPPPEDVPEWDAIFQGAPFLLAADMDLRRINAAIKAARARGFPQIAMAALEGQAEQVLFPRCRDKNLARVFVLTPEAISAVTGRKPVPYVPPHTQFLTAKGEVADAPLIQADRKT